MKNILIISIILLLSSCSINNNEELNNEISTLKQEKQKLIEKNNELLSQISEQNNKSEIFDNNLKCIGNKNNILKYVDKYLKMTSLEKDNLKGDSMIFYSPKTNSCLFSIWTNINYNNHLTYSFRLFEYGTENEILMKNYSCDYNGTEGFSCSKEKSNEMFKIIEGYR